MQEFLGRPRRIFLAQYIVDFRKGHNGLLGEARRHQIDLFAGDLVVFVNRSRNAIKIITGDGAGLTILHRKFSRGSMKTRLRFLDDPSVMKISASEVAMLLEGNEYTVHKSVKKWTPEIVT